MTPAALSRLHALIALQEPSRDSEARGLTEAERDEFEALAYTRVMEIIGGTLIPAEIDECVDLLELLT